MSRSADCTLLCIPPDRVAEFLPHARPFLERAAARSGETAAADVEADVAAGRALLWIVWGNEQCVVAVLVTQLIKTAAGLVCVLLSCAGSDLPRWQGFLAAIERYAAQEQCVAVRIYGRKGWMRVLKNYRVPRVILERLI